MLKKDQLQKFVGCKNKRQELKVTLITEFGISSRLNAADG